MRLQAAKITQTLHKAPDEPFIPEGIPIPGPRPNRSDHPPVSEPDLPLLPPTEEPPAPVRRDEFSNGEKVENIALEASPFSAY